MVWWIIEIVNSNSQVCRFYDCYTDAELATVFKRFTKFLVKGQEIRVRKSNS